MENPDLLLHIIIGVNIVMFVLSLISRPMNAGMGSNPFSLISPSFRSLLEMGMSGSTPVFQYDRWWTLISANYLHGGILHIAFNMFAINQLAPLITREYGPYRMFTIYTIGGIIGFTVSSLMGVKFTIGASAALCAFIGAALYYGKSRGGAYGNAVYRQIGTWAVMIILFGLVMPNIDNWGHLGGMAGGFAIGFILGYSDKRKEGVLHKLLAQTCLAATVVSLGISLYSGFLVKIIG